MAVVWFRCDLRLLDNQALECALVASGTVFTNGRGSPTLQCCKAVVGVICTSADCVCLILTGNMAFGLPINNRTVAISLPKICKSLSVPLVCRGWFILTTIYFHSKHLRLINEKSLCPFHACDVQIQRRRSQLQIA